MAEYLIVFNDEWVPEHTEDDLGEVFVVPAGTRPRGALRSTGG